MEKSEGQGDFFVCFLGYFVPKPLTRLFPQLSWKSRGKRSLSKNFSVILSVCWFTNDDGESLHPILLDSFGIFIIVISMQSDKWKIFRLFRAVFYFKKERSRTRLLLGFTLNFSLLFDFGRIVMSIYIFALVITIYDFYLISQWIFDLS